MNSNPEGVIRDFDTCVIDTSVIINLHKSNYGKQIIQSLSKILVVTQDVKNELDHIDSRIYETHEFLNQILDFDNVKLVELDIAEQALRDKLMDATSKIPTLDSGEASVIALSRYSFAGDNCIPIIDDGKGRSVAEVQLEGKVCGCSLNLFFHHSVFSELGKENAKNALHFALVNAQMSFPKDYRQQVIDLLGLERVRECKSIPGYKELFS